jgi:hypothetical protein
LLVVMTLLSFIVLGLMAVFSQTQRAFKVGLSQVDVLESGRAAMDLITGEVEEMAAMTAMGSNWVNCFIAIPGGNTDLEQELPGSAVVRTNVLQDFFFVRQSNLDWTGIGYTILEGAAGMGTLYRYETNRPLREVQAGTPPEGLFAFFLDELSRTPRSDRLTRVADGVIHFRIQAYGTNGVLLDPYYHRGAYPTITVDYDPASPSQFLYEFRSNALPTAVEIELAVVEPDVVERVQALPAAGTIRQEYLAKETGKVHVFRQRVPIRRADPEAYEQ